MTSVSIGPMSFSIPVFTGILVLVVLLLCSWLADRRFNTNTESTLWKIALISLLAGRAGFVLFHFDVYRQNPMDILNVRDGGFSLIVALIVAAGVLAASMWRRPASRRPILLSLLAGAATLGMAYAGFNLTRHELPVVPDIMMTSLEGQSIPISQFQGKPAVINLWATWCPPCRREMPALQEGQHLNPDINFVFANQGESRDIVDMYLTQEGLSLENVLLDQEGVLGEGIESRGLPTTLFLDQEGRLVDIRLGELSSATLQDRLDALRLR